MRFTSFDGIGNNYFPNAMAKYGKLGLIGEEWNKDIIIYFLIEYYD